jgi:hypothetical protein
MFFDAKWNDMMEPCCAFTVSGSRGGGICGVTVDHPPEHWARLAHEVREQAREMKDPVLRREMERIARGYERLAKHAERTENTARKTR